MSVAKKIGNRMALVGEDISCLFLRPAKNRFRLGILYVGYSFTFLFVRLFRVKKTKEGMLGFTVHFFDYGNFYDQFREIFIHGFYFFRAENGQPSVIDCGSNMGMSVLYFKFLYPDCRIVAIEPDEQNYGMLKRNIEANNLLNVEVVHAALSDHDGSITLYAAAHDAWRVDITASAGIGKLRGAEGYEVPATLLSHHIPVSGADFVKMDIEGAETDVVRASRGVLPRTKEWVMEFHGHPDNPGNSLDALKEMFSRAGFACEPIELEEKYESGIYRFIRKT